MASKAPFGTFFRVKSFFSDDIDRTRYHAREEQHHVKIFGIEWDVDMSFIRERSFNVSLNCSFPVRCDLTVKLFLDEPKSPSNSKDVVRHDFAHYIHNEWVYTDKLSFGQLVTEGFDFTHVEVEFNFKKLVDLRDGADRTIFDVTTGLIDFASCGFSDICDARVPLLMTSLYEADYSKDCRFKDMPDSSESSRVVRFHYVVLQASSLVYSGVNFATRFTSGSLGHARNLADDKIIPYPARIVSLEALGAFVKFMYGHLGVAELFRNKRDLLIMDQYFYCFNLGDLCLEMYRFDMSPTNVLDGLNVAYFYNHEALMDVCLEFLGMKVREVKQFQEYCIVAEEKLRSKLREFFQADTEVLAMIPKE